MRNLYDILTTEAMQEHGNSQLELACEGLLDGNINVAIFHVNQLIFEEISGLQDEFPNKPLYRFAGIPNEDAYNGLLNDIEHHSITLSNPLRFNDPMDPILKVWIQQNQYRGEYRYDRKLGLLLKKAMRNFRICCFSSSSSRCKYPYKNLLMWSHYANKHNGICIQYRLCEDALKAHSTKGAVLKIGEVRYHAHTQMSDNILLDDALLAKSEDWEYEHETRLIYYNVNRTKENFITLKGFHIDALFLGYKLRDDYAKKFKEVARRAGIPVYQMRFDMKDISNMQAELYKNG